MRSPARMVRVLLVVGAAFCLFSSTASAVPILVETVGSVEVTRLHWSSSGCGPPPCGPTGLESGPESLAVSLSMLIDSSTGVISSGAISVVPGQSIIIGTLLNNTGQEIVFSGLDMSFAGNINGSISGFFEEGGLRLIVRSRAPSADVGFYGAAGGPAVIPVTGSSSLNVTQLVFDLSSVNFLHHRTSSAATIDLELGAFSFAVPAIPEPNSGLLLSLGLVGLAAKRKRLNLS